jgi:hypothetical protein
MTILKTMPQTIDKKIAICYTALSSWEKEKEQALGKFSKITEKFLQAISPLKYFTAKRQKLKKTGLIA